MIQWGALHLPSIASGRDGFRWITSCLLHSNSVHLLVNSAILLYLGGVVEYRYVGLRADTEHHDGLQCPSTSLQARFALLMWSQRRLLTPHC